MELEYPEQDFTIEEDELRKKTDNMVARHKNLDNVPVSYSFYENVITAIMSVDMQKSYDFMNNILVQLLAFYTYEDLKVVVFTNKKNKEKWNYIKYIPHIFNNEKTFRLFATDIDSTKLLAEYMDRVVIQKLSIKKQETPEKPYYLVLTDDYDTIKRFDFAKKIYEADENIDKSKKSF